MFDENGKKVYYYFKKSNGYSCEYTYDKNGSILTYKNSKGYSSEYTRDKNSNILTFKNSEGFERGFDIPKYTMKDLITKIGNFKLIK